MVDSVLYVYMIKKNDLQTRIENAKKKMCLTLLDVLSIILIKQRRIHYVKSKTMGLGLCRKSS